MKKIIIVLALLIHGACFAQEKAGVQFEKGSWAEILKKAQASNKFIFVDCYATWCGPCKAMERDVFSRQDVADELSKHFIAVKLQFDKTAGDNEETKDCYAIVKQLQEKYNISAYPTMLFLNERGEILSKVIGQRGAETFTKVILKEALDPMHQYATQVNAYKAGKKNPGELPELINMAKGLNDFDAAQSIAKDYIFNYLLKQSNDSLFTKKNLIFLAGYAQPQNQAIFDLFYKNQVVVDTIFHSPGKSKQICRQGYVSGVINAGLFNGIANRFDSKKYKGDQPFSLNPDWKKIQTRFKKEYPGLYNPETMEDVKLDFYWDTEQYNQAGDIALSQWESQDVTSIKNPMTLVGVNQTAWVIFQKVTDKKILLRAAKLSLLVVNNPHSVGNDDTPQIEKEFNKGIYIDTYANLLYKSGNHDEAIKWEAMAVSLNTKKDKNIDLAYEKMKAGQQTW